MADLHKSGYEDGKQITCKMREREKVKKHNKFEVIIYTAGIVCGRVYCNGTVSILLSIFLSHLSTTAAEFLGPCNSFYCLGHFKNVYDDDDFSRFAAVVPPLPTPARPFRPAWLPNVNNSWFA